MAYLVLARKWRPQTFDDLTGQEHVARILRNALTSRKVAHAYIFSGPRGVGKTTTARILAKALNCVNGPTPDPCGECPSCTEVKSGSSIDVSEIDGASNTGVDNIRDLRERIRYAPSGSRYKVYIIDEAHMLSTSAFNALLKTLEEPPEHVIFVLATTEPKKIPPTVLSRCQHLPFTRISAHRIKERLKVISDAEGIKTATAALDMIARTADGSMRDALTILDQVVSFTDDITAAEVKDLLGITDSETMARITGAVIDGNRPEIIRTIAELADSGTDLKVFARELLQFVRNLMVMKITGGAEDIIDVSEVERSSLATLMQMTSEEHSALLLSELIRAEPGIRSAYHPRVALEMILIKLSLLSRFTSVNEALKTLHGSAPAVSPQKEAAAIPAQAKPQAAKAQETIKTQPAAVKDLPEPVINKTGPEEQQGMPEEPRRVPLQVSRDASVGEIWNAAVESIDETNHPLASRLREATLSGSGEGGDITLVFTGGASVHIEPVKESLPLVHAALQAVTGGRTLRLKIEKAKSEALSRKELKEKALKDPVINEALELFEGRIVDVIPVRKGGENV